MTYHDSIAPLAFILSTNDSLAERSFQGVAETDLWTRPTPQSNPMLWIFGHIVHMRGQMVRLLGGEFDAGWGDVFSRGAALQESAGYPTRERLVEVSRDVNARLYAALGALSADDVTKPAARAFTPAVKTLGDQLSFLTMHDTYHTGQLGYVRKALGLPGVVG
jgi:uncharacterized damage-inducible protein DinB